jgi:phosphoenolpyruvate-protein kinase (PTS system EI component)
MKSNKLWIGMCGELAAQEDYIPLLIALGFSELSVSPGALLRTRRAILSQKLPEAKLLLQKALKAKSSQDLKSLLTFTKN